jgi:hypothetical protein
VMFTTAVPIGSGGKKKVLELSSYTGNNFLSLGKLGKYPTGRCIKVV